MELAEDYIVSEEQWDPRLEEIQRNYISDVKDFKQQGLLSQSSVYERLLRELEDDLSGTWRSNQVIAASLSRTWEALREPDYQHLSEVALARLLSKRLSFPDAPETTAFATLVYKILLWQASFPFENSAQSLSVVDEKGFKRAVILLTQRQESHPLFSSTFSLLGSTWGVYDGWYLTKRGRSSFDVRRSLFRSLATALSPSGNVAADNAGEESAVDTVQIPRYEVDVPLSKLLQKASSPHVATTKEGLDNSDSQDEEETRQVVFMAEEDERNVDLLDVLAWTPPDNHPAVANPMRESYCAVLGGELSGYKDSLRNLRVSRSSLLLLRDMVRTFEELNGDEPIDEAVQLDLPGGSEEIAWEQFNLLLEGMRLVDGLQTLMGKLMDVPVPQL